MSRGSEILKGCVRQSYGTAGHSLTHNLVKLDDQDVNIAKVNLSVESAMLINKIFKEEQVGLKFELLKD